MSAASPFAIYAWLAALPWAGVLGLGAGCVGMNRTTVAGRHPKFRLRRTIVTVDQTTRERAYRDEPWEWKATQRPPFVVRTERRAANKRARSARRKSRA